MSRHILSGLTGLTHSNHSNNLNVHLRVPFCFSVPIEVHCTPIPIRDPAVLPDDLGGLGLIKGDANCARGKAPATTSALRNGRRNPRLRRAISRQIHAIALMKG